MTSNSNKLAESLDAGIAKFTICDGNMGLSISAVGDVSLGPAVQESVDRQGISHVFQDVKEILARSDWVFGNLEYPLTTSTLEHPAIKHIARRAHPSMIEVLRDGGFSLMSIANNHIMDFLIAGLDDTVQSLGDASIRCAGAGSNLLAAEAPAYFDSNAIRAALLAFTYPLKQIAGDNFAGCAENQVERMEQAVKNEVDRVNHVIVSIHAGAEFQLFPTPALQKVSRLLVDAGAKAVLYHHAHVPQGMEIYNGALIAYGLGNFICNIHDDYFRSVGSPYLNKAMILGLDFDESKLLSVTVEPTEINDDLSVTRVKGKKQLEALKFLADISFPLEDMDRLDYLQVDKSLGAKLSRLLAKSRKIGIIALSRELYRDAVHRVRFSEKVDAQELLELQQQLSKDQRIIDPNQANLNPATKAT